MADAASAAKALQTYAGLTAAEAKRVVDAVVEGAKREALELIAGGESFPSTVNDLRALRLRYVCEQLGRVLRPIEVEVVFRLPPTSARTLLRKMSATYPGAVDELMTKGLASAASVRKTGADPDFRYEIFFGDTVSADHAYQLLQRNGLVQDVRRRVQVLDVPRKIGGKDPLDVLGLPKP